MCKIQTDSPFRALEPNFIVIDGLDRIAVNHVAFLINTFVDDHRAASRLPPDGAELQLLQRQFILTCLSFDEQKWVAMLRAHPAGKMLFDISAIHVSLRHERELRRGRSGTGSENGRGRPGG